MTNPCEKKADFMPFRLNPGENLQECGVSVKHDSSATGGCVANVWVAASLKGPARQRWQAL
jgi:hypothetical protein